MYLTFKNYRKTEQTEIYCRVDFRVNHSLFFIQRRLRKATTKLEKRPARKNSGRKGRGKPRDKRLSLSAGKSSIFDLQTRSSFSSALEDPGRIEDFLTGVTFEESLSNSTRAPCVLSIDKHEFRDRKMQYGRILNSRYT